MRSFSDACLKCSGKVVSNNDAENPFILFDRTKFLMKITDASEPTWGTKSQKKCLECKNLILMTKILRTK